MAIKIDDLIPLLEPGWVAMDEDGTWSWFSEEPKMYGNVWISGNEYYLSHERYLKKIKPVKDWTKSLRKVA